MQHLADFAAVFVSAFVVTLGAWAVIPSAVTPLAATVVLSASMGPTIRAGDVVLVAPSDGGDADRGTVVLFDDPIHQGRRLLHRVHEVTDAGTLITKGDANPGDDGQPLSPRQVVGTGRILVPFVGLPAVWLRRGQLYLTLAWLVVIAAAVTRVGTRAGVVFGPPASTLDRRAAMGQRHIGIPLAVGLLMIIVGSPPIAQAWAAWSAETTSTGDLMTLDVQPPTGVAAQQQCQSLLEPAGASVTWVAPDGQPVDRYILERAPAGTEDWIVRNSNASSPQFDTIDVLPLGASYRYRVRSVFDTAVPWTDASAPTSAVSRPICTF